MAIKIKTESEIKIMREAGKILALILEEISSLVKPGVTTKELDNAAQALCKKYNVIPAFKGYNDFPACICTGVDDVAVHGIPSEYEILSEGQIVSLDMGVIHKGYYSDHAVTAGVGTIDSDAQKLLSTTKMALSAAIAQAIPGNTIGDIGYAIEMTAKLAGLSVITQMTGHGIGKNLHEDPAIPCFGVKGKGPRLQAGMTLAIEPMLNEGLSELYFEDDGWTTRTVDGKRSAIFEHTVLVTSKKAEILTIK